MHLSIAVPAGCGNNCKFCIAKMQRDNYRYCGRRNLFDEYARRMAYAKEAGCSSLTLTGEGEPLMNRTFLNIIGSLNRRMSSPDVPRTLVLREDAKLYSRWDDKGSLIFQRKTMLTTEVFYRNRHWRWAVVEIGRLGQIIDRLVGGRSKSHKAALRRSVEALTVERNKRNA